MDYIICGFRIGCFNLGLTNNRIWTDKIFLFFLYGLYKERNNAQTFYYLEHHTIIYSWSGGLCLNLFSAVVVNWGVEWHVGVTNWVLSRSELPFEALPVLQFLCSEYQIRTQEIIYDEYHNKYVKKWKIFTHKFFV